MSSSEASSSSFGASLAASGAAAVVSAEAAGAAAAKASGLARYSLICCISSVRVEHNIEPREGASSECEYFISVIEPAIKPGYLGNLQ